MTKNFVLKLCLFFLPAVVLMGGIAFLSVYTGEAMPLNQIVAFQSGDEATLYGPRTNEHLLAYKVEMINVRQPEILVMGSSRMLEFRAGLFDVPANEFYNASGPGWGLFRNQVLLDAIDEDATPRLILLGVDHMWFSPHLADRERDFELEVNDLRLDRLMDASNRWVRAWLSGNVTLDNLLSRQESLFGLSAMGLRALEDSFGYRNDGSLLWGSLTLNPNGQAVLRQEALQRFAATPYIALPHGDTLDTERLIQMNELLESAQARGIVVIGFATPFMPTYYERLIDRVDYAYLADVVLQVETLFSRYGYAFVDLTDAQAYGGEDEEFIDGWHTMERMVVRMMLQLIEAKPEILDDVTDREALRHLLEESADDPMTVFTYGS